MNNLLSSPAADSPDPAMLTPRSKVAKMLADIDNAPTPSPPQRATTAQAEIRKLTDPDLRTVQAPNAAVKPLGPAREDSESDDEVDLDVPLRRPHGRAARRMLELRKGSPPTRNFPTKQLESSPPLQQHLDPDDEDLYSVTPLRRRITPDPDPGSPSESAKSGALFVSPAKSTGTRDDDDDDEDEELPRNPFGSKEKLAALVSAKRHERLRREEQILQARRSLQENSRKRRRSASAHASSDLPEGMVDVSGLEVNPEIERIMSDAARPTRKASKKALLEMERETQRLARQQALAHQMKVKKKFTTSDLFARFNFQQPGGEGAVDTTTAGKDAASSSSTSDIADMGAREPISTPPSSPPTAGPTPLQKQEALVEQGALTQVLEDGSDEELPDIVDVLRSSRMAGQPTANEPRSSPTRNEQDRRGLKLARLGKAALVRRPEDSSDDDLEIMAPLPRHLQVFDRIKPHDKNSPAESRALHALKHLAQMGGYDAVASRKAGRGPSRPSIGPKALEAQLRRKAKDQARVQQQERIADLRARGVVIQSAEEREREAEVFENLLERARQDAQKIRKAEKAALTKEEGAGGNGSEASDDEEDEEYVGSESEDEERQEVGEGVEDGDEHDGLVDETEEEQEEADLDGDDVAEIEGESDIANDEGQEAASLQPGINAVTPAPANRKARQSRVIRDEDDSDANDDEAQMAGSASHAHILDEEDPFAAFNFQANGGSNDALLSPTQAFQATMQTPTQATQEDSFDILRKIAPPSITSLPPTVMQGYVETQQTLREDNETSVVPGSQVPESQRIELAWEMQPPETPTAGTLQRGASGLSETPGWEPTQDAGLPSPWTLGVGRKGAQGIVPDEHETQSTVRLRVSESPAPSAVPVQRRGRLVRRQGAVLNDSSDDEEVEVPEKLAKKNAFREMARRRQTALTKSERADAAKEMKQMLEEQAEESEDDYAGLGGDDFVAPETDADREMIDSSHVEVDERQIARIFAEGQRRREEEEMSKLYKDLTSGALRRKQANASWGIEEDDGEMEMRRRQMKQLEEARKRKLLLQDDNIAGLAQGRQSKGKDAFLKAIADDDDDAGDELYEQADGEEEGPIVGPEETQTESQPSQQQPVEYRPLQEVSGNKRRLADIEGSMAERPPAKQRRTQASVFKKPGSLLEVQESLSFLLEEPDAIPMGPSVDLDSDSENEEQHSDHPVSEDEDDDLEQLERQRQNDGGFAPNPTDFDARAMPPPRLPASQRRTAAPATLKPGVVDRLSLKRGSSTSDNAAGRTAWATPATGMGFKAPSLLRRATTANTSSAGMANDRGVTVGSASLSRENSGSGSGVRMGGSKKSSLAYQARAEERKTIVEASARRREENIRRVAELRRSSTSALLGRGLGGRFE
ncbi:hypothetical protein LTR35_009145 [Friedmanniomyces endolithicus]|uniref:DNA replication checkpoint mediator MRC1 domain-containing protein n=1 Tax=Friedmanniomyces endolithicus TaxID=329885 RepID=A0AAN6FKN9_9PEZI|nr:hypothetical protein LTR35_009145 [Friedmanniomyces endolithicus]KAK0292204.1 hypothetical protein LTS00_008039 [Friedmanniomyces endolithicus]KAK0320198.1 hypothetical protein LTR82_008715 [Friedmanniomyces endolithicus]KAK0986301.1 hypothetical protein LTR54_013472 [Friedmanniomyces endolithicus]